MYEDEKRRILEEKAIGNKPDDDGESKKSKSSESEAGEKERDFISYRTYEVLKILADDEELIKEVGLKRFQVKMTAIADKWKAF